MNWYIVPLAALIPLITGFIWYNDKVFGKAWMQASGFDPSKASGSGMGKIFALTYVFGLFLSLMLLQVVVHQMHVGSIFADIPNASDPGSDMMVFMEKYGKLYRTFKHGAFHGVLAGIFFAMPITGIVALYERRSAKYIFVHVGYWTLTMALMGGVICAYA
jgi:hypothetical protein